MHVGLRAERGEEIAMIQPQSLDVILSEFSEQQTVWAIQGKSGRYLAIPDHRFPGRRPIRFLTTQYDADRLIASVLALRPELEKQHLVVVEVRLLDAIRKVSAEKTPALADSYVINTPGELSDLIGFLKAKATK
jgi:hypothetical protein